MYSTKLSVSIHILCLIARNDKVPLTSQRIAGSIGTNPALVRRLTNLLKKAGLIFSRPGVGIVGLKKAADQITLLEIFQTVEPEQRLFDMHTNTNENCFVGANIGRSLTGIYEELQESFEKRLNEFYLSDILQSMEKAGHR